MSNMYLVMVDECGDECYVGEYTLTLDLDTDELDIWQARKIEQASARYLEARGFYFEDRRGWNHAIAMNIHEWF